MKIITVASLKGGVGKTSISIFLARALAKKNRVLTVDFDAQASLTDYFLRDVDFEEFSKKSSYHFLSERKEASGCIIQGNGADVIPSTLEVHNLSNEMMSDPGAIFRVKKDLIGLQYDYIIIDTPPGLSYEFRAGLYSADHILTPIHYDRWSLQGLSLLQVEVGRMKKNGINPKLTCVPSIVTPSEDEMIREVLSKKSQVTDTRISRSTVLKTAIYKSMPLKDGSTCDQEFKKLSEVVL